MLTDTQREVLRRLDSGDALVGTWSRSPSHWVIARKQAPVPTYEDVHALYKRGYLHVVDTPWDATWTITDKGRVVLGEGEAGS